MNDKVQYQPRLAVHTAKPRQKDLTLHQFLCHPLHNMIDIEHLRTSNGLTLIMHLNWSDAHIMCGAMCCVKNLLLLRLGSVTVNSDESLC